MKSTALITTLFSCVLAAQAVEALELCACTAQRFGFEIDCSNKAAQVSAVGLLSSGGCQNDCTSDVCLENFAYIEIHHDHCIPADVAEQVELNFHLYEQSCASACTIQRLPVQGFPNCQAPVCDDSTGNDAFAAMEANGCLNDCTNCAADFRTLRAVHDGCPDGTLSLQQETEFNEFKEVCKDQDCNMPYDESQLTCTDPDSAAAASTASLVLGAAAGFAAILA